MKNLSLVLNAVLFVAVGVLFYLNFSGKKPAASTDSAVVPGNVQVAYIKTDSVLKNYEFLKTTRDVLMKKGEKLERDFQNRAQALKNDFDGYQRNVGSLTIGQAKAIEEDLQKKQQNLQMFQQQLNQVLENDQQQLTQELFARLTAYVKKYSAEKGIQYVMKLDAGSDLLYAGDTFDITEDVVNGLNAEYKAEKTTGATKKDSTATKK